MIGGLAVDDFFFRKCQLQLIFVSIHNAAQGRERIPIQVLEVVVVDLRSCRILRVVRDAPGLAISGRSRRNRFDQSSVPENQCWTDLLGTRNMPASRGTRLSGPSATVASA